MEVIYEGSLRTRAIHLSSGAVIMTDAPVDNQGRGEAFSPTDLASASLASCMLTILGILASAHHFNIDGTKAEVTKVMASDPRRIAGISVRLIFPQSHTLNQKQQEMIKRAALTCPVALSLSPEVQQEITFCF